MRVSEEGMITFTDGFSSLNNNASHQGIGACSRYAFLSKLDGKLHPFFMIIHFLFYLPKFRRSIKKSGSLACFMAGGEVWEEWNEALKAVLPTGQNPDGSFEPIDPYADLANDTSRDKSYTTAMCVLSLEVYYRYFTPLLEKQ